MFSLTTKLATKAQLWQVHDGCVHLLHCFIFAANLMSFIRSNTHNASGYLFPSWRYLYWILPFKLNLIWKRRGDNVFLAANLRDNHALMPHYALQLLALVVARPAGSIFLSIYESGSKDDTGTALFSLQVLGLQDLCNWKGLHIIRTSNISFDHA